MCLRLLHRQLFDHKRELHILCVYEGKLVEILKDQTLFLMRNTESAELKTQLCGSNRNIVSSVSQCSLSIHCVQGSRYVGRETSRRCSAHVLERHYLFLLQQPRSLARSPATHKEFLDRGKLYAKG